MVRVFNQGSKNISLHWHGVHEPRNPWSDGPGYITQCPIQPGASFTQTIIISSEEGTLWWHAHSDWDRATVHGAFVVYPRAGTSSPLTMPYKEIHVILGEWWIKDIDAVLEEAEVTGGAPEASNAYTINGQPGDFCPCSAQETYTAMVKHDKTYLLRVINAAMNAELFFAVAGHQLTVVGTDGCYTKPFTTDYIMITPGQTMDLLLKPNQTVAGGGDDSSAGRYYMAARAYSSADTGHYDNTTATAILEYTDRRCNASPPLLPALPDYGDTAAAAAFTDGLRSLASKEHPADVPKSVDERIIISVSLNEILCPNQTCLGPDGNRFAASLNNLSFVDPWVDVLQAYYYKISGVYGTGFPARPPVYYNFTGDDLPKWLLITKKATEVRVVEYGRSLEIVFQGTSLIKPENHPMHLHGYSFYVVGRGFGNWNEKTDPLGYNLVDPPLENTVGVPKGGWAAVRFRATNPGVWFMHCHLERHLTWGMDTVFIVKNGLTPGAQMLPPPPDMPPC